MSTTDMNTTDPQDYNGTSTAGGTTIISPTWYAKSNWVPVASAGTIPTSSITAGTISFAPIGTVSHGVKISDSEKSTSAVLPPIIFSDFDEHKKQITLTLRPEENIPAADALKLALLLFTYNKDRNAFSAFAYVKANNLERHFKFDQV